MFAVLIIAVIILICLFASNFNNLNKLLAKTAFKGQNPVSKEPKERMSGEKIKNLIKDTISQTVEKNITTEELLEVAKNDISTPCFNCIVEALNLNADNPVNIINDAITTNPQIAGPIMERIISIYVAGLIRREEFFDNGGDKFNLNLSEVMAQPKFSHNLDKISEIPGNNETLSLLCEDVYANVLALVSFYNQSGSVSEVSVERIAKDFVQAWHNGTQTSLKFEDDKLIGYEYLLKKEENTSSDKNG